MKWIRFVAPRSGLALGLLWLAPSPGQAQQIDPNALGVYPLALQFSQYQPHGSVRTLSMGSINTALGADLSALSGNPAGLGAYRKSEFSFSPTFNAAGNSLTGNTLQGNVTDRESRASFNFSNIGAAFYLGKDDIEPGRFRGFTLGIGVNRLANFNSRSRWESYSLSRPNSDGTYTPSSLIDVYDNYSRQPGVDTTLLDPDLVPSLNYYQGLTNLAYSNYMLDKQSGNRFFRVPLPYGSFRQTGSRTTSGSMNEWNLALGGNFDDRIYFGAGLGLVTLRYEEETDISETYDQVYSRFAEEQTFVGARINEYRRNTYSGAGVNLKAGFIFRPVPQVRLGISAQTPSYLSVNRTGTVRLSTQYNGAIYIDNSRLGSYSAEAELSDESYSLRTPGRINGGVALMIGKHGFVSADAEYVDYGSATFSSAALAADQRTVERIYTSAFNYRVGGEYRFDELRLRAGYQYSGNPYSREQATTSNRGLQSFSGGIGYRDNDYALDLGVVHTVSDGRYRPHQFAPIVNTRTTFTSLILSAGFFF